MIISLKTPRYVGGILRSPDEGPITVDDGVGQDFVGEGAADDVSADFPGGLQPDAEPAKKAKAAE